MAIRTTITGTQIKDETVDSADIASGSIKVGELNADAVVDQTTITSIDTTNDYLLIWDATDSALKKVAPTNLGIGGSGSPGGSDTQIQYNNNSSFGGVSGVTTDGTNVTFGNTALLIGKDIIHDGDTDTYIRFTADAMNVQAGGVDFIQITENDSQDKITFNDGGANIDFIVESADETKALYLNAANNAFHVNHGETAFTTKIHHINGLALTVDSSGIIFNEDSQSSIDFRVESAGEDEAIFLDASSNTLYVNKGATSFTTVIKSTNEEAIRVGASGVIFNQYGHASNDFRVESDTNTHILFVDAGNDKVGIGTSSPSTALEVSGSLTITDDIAFDDGGSIKASSTTAITIDSSGEVTKIGQDSPSSDQVLTWDGSKAVWSAAAGGGSNTFVMSQAIEQVNSMSTSYYYYKNVVGGYGYTNNFSPTNFSTSFPYWRVGRYASSGVIPVAADLIAYHLVGHKDSSDNDTINLKVWKVPAPANGDAETDIPTLVEIISIEIDVDGNQIFNKSGTLTSSNSFAAGDQWMITLNANAYMTGEHYAHLSLVFEPS